MDEDTANKILYAELSALEESLEKFSVHYRKSLANIKQTITYKDMKNKQKDQDVN